MPRLGRVLRTAFHDGIRSSRIRDHETVKENVAKGIVQRNATGNVRLQRGQYLTQEQADENFERVKEYSFDE